MLDKIRQLFTRKPAPPPPPMRDIDALTRSQALPAVQVFTSTEPSRSYIRGDPALPDESQWPAKNGKRLDFLARLSLAEIHAAHTVDWLPREGALVFFYDLSEQVWGFDPEDRGSFAVLHVPDLTSTRTDDKLRLERPRNVIPRRMVAFRRILSRPSWERGDFGLLNLTEKEWDALAEIQETEFGGAAYHQIAGYPDPVQGDHMELECQLVTHGLYCGDSRGFRDPRARQLESGAANWKLLFQMDSDDELDLMWGDVGRLYFWIEESRARAADFSNVWLISQCH